MTDSSSPGTLAMREARATPCLSSSLAQVCASSSDGPGKSQPASSATPRASRPPGAPSDSRKRREKKCTCESQTSRSPQGVCIRFVPVRDAGGQRKLCEACDVVDAELLHHGLAIAADGLQSEIEEDRDILAGLPF